MNDNYLAYLLRLKRTPGRPQWRATLENAHTGTVRHFASEEELLLFLMDRLAGDRQPQDLNLGLDMRSIE